LKIDLHVHTRISTDSIIPPKKLMEKSIDTGVVPTITDHNSMASVAECKKLGPCIAGEEVRTDKGDLIGLFLNEPIKKGTPFSEAADLIHEQGALTYLPHMFDISRSGAGAAENPEHIDIIETFNSRCMMDDYNKKAEEFASRHNIPKAAGSDSHFLFEFGSTYTEMPGFDPDEPKGFLKSLKSARLICNKAPIFVRGSTSMMRFVRSVIGWPGNK
jgi:hypothetical protein